MRGGSLDDIPKSLQALQGNAELSVLYPYYHTTYLHKKRFSRLFIHWYEFKTAYKTRQAYVIVRRNNS